MLENILESPLDRRTNQSILKEINPSNILKFFFFFSFYLDPIFIGRTDAEAEVPILWPSDAKADSLEKTLMLGKIEG